MNKTELINQVAPIVGTQKMAKEAVECVLNAIADALAEKIRARLIARQWAKHGSCMTKRPETYFAVTRVLWESLRIPDYDRISREEGLTAGRIRQAFLVDVCQQHPGALPAEAHCAGATDTRGGTGHEGGFTLEPIHGLSPYRSRR